MPVQPTLTWTPRPLALLAVPAFIFAMAQAAAAEPDATLAPVIVTGPTGSFETLGEISSVTRIDGKSAREAVGAAGASPAKAIENAPSVNFQNADPYGLTEVGYHETLKIRGVGQTGPASSRNINDLPITANPGGSKGIIDMEDVAEVSLYRGAAPADKTLGFSDLPGKINLQMLAPQAEAGSDYGLATGSDAFNRVFLRHDFGKHGILSSFISGSYTEADKWKGSGDSERNNLTAGLALDGGKAWQAEVYAGYNHDARNTYRFFDYATASSMANYGKDWGADPTKVDYFGYNRQDFTDKFVFGSFATALSDSLKLTLKPYYLTETGDYWFSSINATTPANSRVVDWIIDHENMGLVSQLDWALDAKSQLKAGLWLHSQQPPGPPATQAKYTVGASGLTFNGWSMLADNERHRITSPYVDYFRSSGNLDVELGLRYLDMRLGALTAYNNTGAAATLSNPDAARAAGSVNPMASAGAKTLTAWLPFVGLNWRLDPQTSLFGHAGRTYGLDVNLFPYYYAQQAAFAAKGVSFQSLWDRLKLETADNLDLGIRRVQDGWHAGLTTYYALHHNKQSTIYDPATGTRYPWNMADATRYGIELEGGVELTPNLSLLGNYSWNSFRYDQNLATSATTIIASEGKQVVDTPENMVKAGLQYHRGAWRLGMDARYVGERYGDVLNQERVPGVTLVDAMAQYHFSKAMTLTLDARNLFDRKYIGPISAADDATAAATVAFGPANTSTYQYGAPRAVFLSLSGQF